MRKDARKFLSEMAGAVHGLVGGANLLIAYYNFKRGNNLRGLLHIVVAGYEGKCFHEHWEERERPE